MTKIEELDALRSAIAPESAEEHYLLGALENATFTALFEDGWPVGTEQWAELVLSGYAANKDSDIRGEN